MNDPSSVMGTSLREGDLSDIQVVDVYRRKWKILFFTLDFSIYRIIRIYQIERLNMILVGI
jgi:hypothetical protein